MATRALNVPITGDAKGLGRAVKDADRHLDKLEKDSRRVGGRFGANLAKGAKVAGVGVAAGVGIATLAVKDFTDAAAESEVSNARMVAQLEASGISYEKYAGKIDKVISAQSKLSALDDEDLQDSFTNLVRVTGDVNKALELNAVAADFARAKGMDVAKAGELIGKVAGGNVGILGRYGIQVRKGASETEALALLQAKFAGQAEAYGDTAAGAQERFAVTIGNVKETLGEALLPALTDVTNKVDAFVTQIMDGTGAGGEFADKVTAGFERAKGAAEVLWPVLRDGGKVAFDLLREGFERGEQIVGFFVDTKDAVAGWARENREQIRAVVDTVKGALGEAVDWLSSALPSAFGTVKTAVASAFQFIADFVSRNRDTILAVASAIVSGLSSAFQAVKGAVVTAFEAVKTAVSTAVEFVAGWIDRHRDDISAFGQAWKNIGTAVAVAVGGIALAVKWAFENVIAPVVKRVMDVVLAVVKTVWPSIRRVIEGVLQAIGGLINVFSGVFTGDFARIWEGVKDIFSGGVKAVKNTLEGLIKGAATIVVKVADAIKDALVAGLKGLGKLLLNAVVSGIKWAVENVPGLVADVVKGLGSKVVGWLVPGGDGLGRAIGDGVGKMIPRFGGSLMGARPNMAPVAGIASRFGLGVSSGLRQGAVTSSGNRSYHSTGEALDIAGNPSGMLAFFRYMKNTLGGRLAELIYTPGGAGIRNGSPHTYSGRVAADHFDHVHVAIDSGAPGVGDGIGAEDRKLITSAASSGGIGPDILYGVWGAESNFSRGPGPVSRAGARGPFQFMPGTAKEMGVNPGNLRSAAFGAAKYLGRYKGRGVSGMLAAYNAGPAGNPNNAETQKYIPTVLGFAKQWSTAGSGTGGSGSKSKSGVATGRSGNVTPAFYAGPEAPDAEQQRAIDFVNKTGQFAPGRPLKGGGPTKGFTPEEVAAGFPEAARDRANPEKPDPPTVWDYMDAESASAALSETLEDDKWVAGRRVWHAEQDFAAAQASGDPRLVAAAGQRLKTERDALASLEKTMKDFERSLTQALDDLKAEIKRSNDFAAAVGSSNEYQLTKTLADLLSGFIVGRGVVGRSFTPGTGVEYAY